MIDFESKGSGKKVSVHLENRMETLGDGKTINGYEKIRRSQVDQAVKEQDRENMRVGYKTMAALYKGS